MQVSSDPHNSMPEHAEGEPAPAQVRDQTPPAPPRPAEAAPASGAGQQPPAEGPRMPADLAEEGVGSAGMGAWAQQSPSGETSTPPAPSEETGTEAAPAVPEVAEKPAPRGKKGVRDAPASEERAKAAVSATAEPPPTGQPATPAPSPPKSDRMDWYILKVQSNREESIREGLRRRIAVAGYDHYFGDIIIPMEKVTEVKAGKKRTYKRKLYPGYLMVQMEINEDTWFLVRETPGIGDFTGAGGHPTPMNPREVQAILAKQEEKPDQQEKVKINFRIGDRVKIKEGTFESFEGEVSSIDETNGRVTVLINIFGRSTPVDIEYWQIEAV